MQMSSFLSLCWEDWRTVFARAKPRLPVRTITTVPLVVVERAAKEEKDEETKGASIEAIFRTKAKCFDFHSDMGLA
jgi:hypothetical protein